MRKVIYAMSVSLDGFIEDTNGDLSWSFPDEELHKHFNDLEMSIDTHLYGRRLYENMAAYWPTAEENPSAPEHELAYARIWKSMPKIVFSKTLDQVGWNSRLVRGNIADEVNQLKEQPGKDLSVVGAELAATFMQLGLIDEYWLYVHPVVLGGGKPMLRMQEQLSRTTNWCKPPLSRYPGLHQVYSGFIPGGIHQNIKRDFAVLTIEGSRSRT